jgi:hypothetical protein
MNEFFFDTCFDINSYFFFLAFFNGIIPGVSKINLYKLIKLFKRILISTKNINIKKNLRSAYPDQLEPRLIYFSWYSFYSKPNLSSKKNIFFNLKKKNLKLLKKITRLFISLLTKVLLPLLL